jgi:translocation and assembly module TamB
MRRIGTLFLRITLTLLLILTTALFLGVGTEGGTRALLTQILKRMNSQAFSLEIQGITGTLLRQVNADRALVQQGEVVYAINDFVGEISLLALIRRELVIEKFAGSYTVPAESLGHPKIRFSSHGEFERSKIRHFTLDWDIESTNEIALLLRTLAIPSAGEFSISGKARVFGSFDSITISHELYSPWEIDSEGTVDLFALAHNFEHSSKQLLLRREESTSILLNPKLMTAGDEKTITVDFAAEFDDLNNRQRSMQTLANVPNLKISASADLTARNANFAVSVLEPAELIAAFTEFTLSSLKIGPLSVSGTLSETPHGSIALSIDRLDTTIDATPLTFASRVELSADGVTVEELELVTAGNSIAVRGSARDRLSLDFFVNITDWNEFVPGARGSLVGEGHLDGTTESPIATISIAGSGFGYESLSIERLTIDAELNAEKVDGTFLLERGVFTEEQQRPVTINGRIVGAPSAHSFDFAMESGTVSSSMSLQGGFRMPFILDADLEWTGHADTAQLSYLPAGAPWTLQTPLVFKLSRNSALLRRSCWRQESATACIEYALQDSQKRAQLDIESLPISTLIRLAEIPALDDLIDIYGAAGSVDASAYYTESGTSRAALTSNLTAKQLSFHIGENNEQENYSLEDVDLAASLEEGSWRVESRAVLLKAPATNPAEDSKEADSTPESSSLDATRGASTRLADIEAEGLLHADRSLNGNITLQALGLEWLEAFTPELVSLSGQFTAQLSVSGSLESPLVSATSTLINGAVTLPSLGIRVDGITMDAEMTDSQTLTLQAQGQSGEGNVDISISASALDLLQNAPRAALMRGEATVRGNDFLIIANDTLRATASPNFTVVADGGALHYSGDVAIPELKLTLSELPPNAIDISTDTVLVEVQREADKPLSLLERITQNGITGELVLALGNKASIEGFGIDTQLEGRLRLQRGQNQSNLAYGELSLSEGSYTLYGQSLAIRQGRFVFLGALNNPSIDLRAVREINEQTVGVQMGGTLKNMNSTLFSTPNLGETDILAMLVTGRPFASIGQRDQGALLGSLASLGLERNSGLTNQIRSSLGLDELSIDTKDTLNNTVLTVGKYLTPNLFARYGVGIFDSSSKVNLDYALSDRLKLKAESGIQQSVDLVYSVEK